MIKHLILNNLVLVDQCEIHFTPGFNAITGETGAGKTALIEAIALALGNRADTTLIRKGSDKALVEIAFDIDALPNLHTLLEEAGISCDPHDYLIIRREIFKEGKNRAFLNCRLIPLPFLQKVGAHLIDLIAQSTHQDLRTTDTQRALIDRFGSLEKEYACFQSSFAKEKEFSEKLATLQTLLQKREREEETLRFQLEEIESVGLKSGEEEILFEKYQRLAHAQELNEKITQIIKVLSDSPSALLLQLSRFHKTCESLQTYDSSLSDAASLFHEAQIALSEALRTLQSATDGLDADPNTFQFLENRLTTISRLKRKYGQTFDAIEQFHLQLQTDLSRFAHLLEEIQNTEKELTSIRRETDQAASTLTQKRKKTSLRLEKILTHHLHMLNMNGAELQITLSPQTRHTSGDDLIQFFLKANAGEHPGLVKEHTSGGELSRLLFAIKTTLAEKNDTPTLLFDEIDANVGGKTASIIGEHLKALGKVRQVICITHFPQVASQADTHLTVQKVEKEGRTFTEISLLSPKKRQEELLRMLGGKDFSSL